MVLRECERGSSGGSYTPSTTLHKIMLTNECLGEYGVWHPTSFDLKDEPNTLVLYNDNGTLTS